MNIPRFARFLAVGALNTGFGYGIFATLYLIIGSYRAAIVFATIVGIVFNFFSTGRLVFDSKRWRAFIPFVAGYAIILTLNLVAVDSLAMAGYNPLLAQLFVLPPIVVLSYLINARLVFRKPEQ